MKENHSDGVSAFHYGLFDPETADIAESLLRSQLMLVQGCEFAPGQRILDVGCGRGETAIWLARTHGVRVVGLAHNPADAAAAAEHAEQQRVGHLLEFHHGDFMRRLPCADASFDVVLNRESIRHAADKATYLGEVHRVLKRGGRWQTMDGFLNSAAADEEQEAIHAAVCRGWRIPSLVDWRALLAILEETGFERLDVQDLASQVAPFSAWKRNQLFLRSLIFAPRTQSKAQADFDDAVIHYDSGLGQGILTYCFMSGVKPSPPGRGRVESRGGGPAPGLDTGRAMREARSRDFGKLIKKIPAAVALPRTADEVADIVKWAAREAIPLTVRGGAHSQGGQGLTDRGVVVDMARIHKIASAGRDLVRAQGGAQWGHVVDAMRGTRRLPRVLTAIPQVTVGGTLSAGGLGATSHRFGAQAGQIEQLEVVIGTGERVRCSRTRNAELFDAARAGQGQFGIITEAWVRLREAGARFRGHELRYRDFDRFANDFEHILDEDRFDHLRVDIQAAAREITLKAGKEYDGEIDGENLLGGLGFESIVSTRDTAAVGRAGVDTGVMHGGNLFCPWRDWLLPWECWRGALDHRWLDPAWLSEASHHCISMCPIGTESIDAPLLARPAGKRLMSFSVLAALPRRDQAVELAEKLRQVDRTLIGMGAKSYLSGDVGYSPEQWREHYGAQFETALGWKRKFDPRRVLGEEGMPFSETPAADARGHR